MGRADAPNCPEADEDEHRRTVHTHPRVGPTGARGAAAAVLAIALLGLTATGASAVVRHLGRGRTVSYQPAHGLFARPLLTSPAGKKQGPLLYHGGPIMSSNSNYTFYWAPTGSPAYAAGYQEGINLYFERLAHDSGGRQNVDSVSTQYYDVAGEFAEYKSQFAGAIVDTNAYPASGCTASPICLTDEQLQNELKSYIKAHALPADLKHEYFILTPPGVESCFEAASRQCSAGSATPVYCAYHGYIPVTGGVIIYSDDPYTTGVEGCDTGQHPSESPAEGAIQGGLSHEHNESITDPEITAWTDSLENEIGDKCRLVPPSEEFGAALGTATDGAPYNQVIDGGLYYYQTEFSNQTLNCQQRLIPAPPTVKKMSPKAGPAAGGTLVSITGTGFEKAASVHFGALAAKEVTYISATSLTAVSPAEALGKVPVTVTTANGTTVASPKTTFTFKKK